MDTSKSTLTVPKVSSTSGKAEDQATPSQTWLDPEENDAEDYRKMRERIAARKANQTS